jgi:hypothetical protein
MVMPIVGLYTSIPGKGWLRSLKKYHAPVKMARKKEVGGE